MRGSRCEERVCDGTAKRAVDGHIDGLPATRAGAVVPVFALGTVVWCSEGNDLLAVGAVVLQIRRSSAVKHGTAG